MGLKKDKVAEGGEKCKV